MATPNKPSTGTKLAQQATAAGAVPGVSSAPGPQGVPGLAADQPGDAFGLQHAGYGHALENVPIVGVHDLFGPVTAMAFTAKQVMAQLLRTTDPGLIGQIQVWLYQAGGFYHKDDTIEFGRLRASDVAAFRKFLVGFALNPLQKDTQGNVLGLKGALTEAAATGVASGTPGGRQRLPLTVRLTDPAELRTTLQATAQKLYGGFLPDDQVNRFVSAFQGMQSAEQTQAYTQSGYNPETGQQDASGAATGGGTVTTPNENAQAEEFIRQHYPNQVAATQFGNAMNDIMSILKNPAV